MKHYSFAETVLAHLYPLRLCEDTGARVVDRRTLAETGARYEAIYLMFSLVSAIAAFLLASVSIRLRRIRS